MKMVVKECCDLQKMITEQLRKNTSIIFLLCRCWGGRKNSFKFYVLSSKFYVLCFLYLNCATIHYSKFFCLFPHTFVTGFAENLFHSANFLPELINDLSLRCLLNLYQDRNSIAFI